MASINLMEVLARYKGISESDMKGRLSLNSFDEERFKKLGKQATSLGEEEVVDDLRNIEKVDEIFRDDSDWRKIKEILKIEIRRLK